MATGLNENPVKILVYCPDEGGWHSGVWLRAAYYEGVWFRQGWRAATDHDLELRPTHWLPYPDKPQAERTGWYAIELLQTRSGGV
jgi:hypothetical protein